MVEALRSSYRSYAYAERGSDPVTGMAVVALIEAAALILAGLVIVTVAHIEKRGNHFTS